MGVALHGEANDDVNNVLIRLTTGGAAARGLQALLGAHVLARSLTIVGNAGVAVDDRATGSGNEQSTEVTLDDSIVDGFPTHGLCEATAGQVAKLTVRHSRFVTLDADDCTQLDVATGGSHVGTLTVTDPTGLTASAAATVVVSGGPETPGTPSTPASPPAPGDGTPAGGATPDTRAPVISGVGFGPATFAVSSARTAVDARVRIGTRIRYRLSETSRVRLRFARALTGRRSLGACRAPARAPRHARRCTRYVTRATLSRTGHAGSNQLRFTGRIGRKVLAPGAYRLLVEAIDAAGNRAPAPARRGSGSSVADGQPEWRAWTSSG